MNTKLSSLMWRLFEAPSLAIRMVSAASVVTLYVSGMLLLITAIGLAEFVEWFTRTVTSCSGKSKTLPVDMGDG